MGRYWWPPIEITEALVRCWPGADPLRWSGPTAPLGTYYTYKPYIHIAIVVVVAVVGDRQDTARLLFVYTDDEKEKKTLNSIFCPHFFACRDNSGQYRSH